MIGIESAGPPEVGMGSERPIRAIMRRLKRGLD